MLKGEAGFISTSGFELPEKGRKSCQLNIDNHEKRLIVQKIRNLKDFK